MRDNKSTMQPKEYSDLTQRNIGLLSEEQQNRLKTSCIAVFGVGGLGGVISEILARCGVGSIKIVDNDTFDATNLNRQIFAFRDTLGQDKIEVTEKFLKKINSQLIIEKYKEATEDNIEKILKNTDVAILALDSIKPIIIISRSCGQLNIPLVEGWALPFGNVRVFTAQTPSLEEAYNMPTKGKEISSISQKDFKELKNYMLSTLKNIKGIDKFYPPLAIQRIMEGKIPSFAPMVWLTSVLMSLEAIKIILKWGDISLAPAFSLYDPFTQKIPNKEV